MLTSAPQTIAFYGFLVLAELLEIGPVGIKMAENPERRFQAVIIAIVFMVASGTCLWLAQRQIPMGTAYAVWTASARSGR